MDKKLVKRLAWAGILLVLPFLAVWAVGSRGAASGGTAERRSGREGGIAPVSTPSEAVSIDLGRVVCGDCCVGKVWGAIGAVPGVRDVDVRAGRKTFTVYYDRGLTSPEQLVAKLVAAGESTAGVEAGGAADHQQERRWVRTARH